MAAMSLFTVGCVEEPIQYEKGEPDVDGCYGVYFPVQESDFVVDPADDPVQTLTVKRTNSAGAITVPVEVVTNVEDVLEISPIVFEDGQDETTFTVTYETAEVGNTYTASISVTDPAYASVYNTGATAINFSVLRERWVSLGMATYRDNYFFENEYQAELLQNELNPHMFRLIDPMSEGLEKEGYVAAGMVKTGPSEMLEFEIIQVPYVFYPGKEYEFTVKTEDLVYHEPFKTGVYNSTYASEMWYWHASAIADDETGLEYNKVLGYQENGLPVAVQIAPFVRLTEYSTGGSGFNYTEENDFVTIIFPGAVLVDYSLSVEADYSVAGVTSVEFEAGKDVAEVQYVVLEGETNTIARDAQVAAIVAGEAENVLSVTAEDMYADEDTGVLYGYADVTCPATGKYTIVAVSFDAEGGAQESAYTVFDYVAATDNTYDVTLNVEVADTPARFAADKHTVFNSFMFTVYGGNELTDVKIGLYAIADVVKYGLDVVVADLRYEDEETTMSVLPDTLARINTTAGYTDLYTGLKDNTSYTVVVWGTNGMQTKVAYASYKTEKNPEVFKSLGMATYTDDIVGPLFKASPVTYEVEIEESVDNPGKYRLVNPYGEVFPYNDPGDWDDSQTYYMVIDATNPDAVVIPQQALGVDWGDGMMGVWCMVENYLAQGAPASYVEPYYGKLKDGVITFPANSLIVLDDEGAYYANTNGAFKVVLPGYGDAEGEEETPDEGAETTSVSKSSVKTHESDIQLPMSVGRIAGAGIESETRTVAATATISSNPVRNSSDRNTEIASFTLKF